MEAKTPNSVALLILGWPFLKPTRTTLSMEFGDSIVWFNILDAMKHPLEKHSMFT